jgi:serine/threonine-protein kinase
MVVLEYASYNSLATFIYERRWGLPLLPALRVLTDVAHALVAIHAAGFVHLDVKPDNILLFCDPTAHEPTAAVCAKLGDFGLAVPVARADAACTEAGTYRYMAPEQLRLQQRLKQQEQQQQQQQQHVSFAADIFAFGVTVLELAARRHPFAACGARDVFALYAAGRTVAVPPMLHPPPLRALVARCVQLQPNARPTAQQLVDELSAIRGALAAMDTGAAGAVAGADCRDRVADSDATGDGASHVGAEHG